MLDSIIRFSIKNKATIGLLTIALVIWGGWSAMQLPIDAVPDITDNQVQVITTAPSQSAQDIERLVTFPVEQTMATIPGINQIRSFSRFGLSVVTIVFEEGVDIYWARQQVGERLVEAKSMIPEGVGTPSLAPLTTGLGEIYQYIIRPLPGYEHQYDAMELRTIQDWIVRRQLIGLEGVADVSSFGGYLKQYEIALDPVRLQSMQITITDIFDALAQNNQNTGGAYIDKQPYAWYIRSEGLIENLDDIRNIPVRMGEGGLPILLRDVAKVELGHAVRYGAMTHDGDGEVVGAVVMMLKGANSSKVIGLVKERMAEISKTLPKGIVIEPYLDRSKLVDKAISTVVRNLTEGALIVVLVLVLLLGNLRGGLVVASVIPLAMLFAIAMMRLFGVSGNLMSLGAIDFGLIVDGAVIIVEGTIHHLMRHGSAQRLTQSQMDEEVRFSASKIMTSAAFGEMIILIVYLPILALVGVEGKMFKPMAETVSFAIIGAFLLSLTYVPMVSALFLSKKTAHKRTLSDRLVELLQRMYRPSLEFALHFSPAVVGGAVAFLVVGMLVFTQLGAEFIPTLDEGDFAVETRLLTGSSIEETIHSAGEAAKVLMRDFPEVKTVVGKIGSSEIPTDPMPVESCDLIVVLKDKEEWTSAESRDELAEKMHARLNETLPGVTFGFQQPIQMRFNELMTGARQDVVIKIYGENLDTLAALAARVGHLVSKVEGARDLYIEQATGLSQIVVNYHREQIARFGLSIADVNRALNMAFAGQSAGMIYEGERRFDLVARLEGSNRQSIDDVRQLPIATQAGQHVPLSLLADVNYQTGPNQIQRDDAQRRIIVGFNVRGRDVESLVEELQAQVAQEIDFPPGYHPKYGGTFENLIEARARLAIALPVALLLILILLYFTFNSLGQSLMIFTAIPLSAIGGILALWSRGMPFSISAGVGFIALFGVAVLNGIVLIAEFNRLRAKGELSLREVILQGTSTRLRPVIMTAAVASLGFLPMAISHGNGAEVQRPLATVVIGGLVTATLLTLIVLPCLYWIFNQKTKTPMPETDPELPDSESAEPNAEDKPGSHGLQGAISILVMGILLGLPLAAGAQAQPSTPPLTLTKATEMALQKHAAMQQAELSVQVQQKLVGSVNALPKLDAQFMMGQYNSAEWRDNNVNLSQSLPFPTVFGHRKALANAQVGQAVANRNLTELDVRYQVQETWIELQYLYQSRRQWQRQDSIYNRLVRTAQLRLDAGEGTKLELVNAQTQQSMAQNEIARNQAAIGVQLRQLQWMLNLAELPRIADSLLPPPALDASGTSAEAANHPQVAVMAANAAVAEQSTALERSAMLPDISVGYFNQTLIGYQTRNGNEVYFGPNARFQGFTIGLAIPIWIKPELAKLEANKLQVQQAQLAQQQTGMQLDNLLDQARTQLAQDQATLDWYQRSALPNAALSITQAQRAFDQGEIDYAAFMLHLNQASQIEAGHIDALRAYHLSRLRMGYLSGNLSQPSTH